ncbi:MAG: MutS-related protein [Mucilaginibacter sp.]
MASFEIDRQTLKDLDLFADDGVSVYSFFSQVKTLGGQYKLKEMMETPSSDIDILRSRRDSFRFFYDKQFYLEVNKNQVDFVEHYLNYNLDPLKPNFIDAVAKGIKYRFSPHKDYYTVTQGIVETRKLIKRLNNFYLALQGEKDVPPAITAISNMLFTFFAKKEIAKLLLDQNYHTPGYLEVARYDNLFRKAELVALKDILKLLYELDVFIAVAVATLKHGFCFPEYESSGQPHVNIIGLFHPCVKKPVPNNVVIDKEKNLWFLTGANMAGKSTYLKALGLAIYLAHIGFPVPANQMQTTVFGGLITTINLSDDINSGYSHYFSEIKRLKKVAGKVAELDNLFVVFDELLRGTNVKDAYHASLATIKALSKIKNSVFLISTHIVEIAAELKECENIAFKYFEATIADDQPVYDYQLKDGVSSETLGYFIFDKEGIVKLLEQAAVKRTLPPSLAQRNSW